MGEITRLGRKCLKMERNKLLFLTFITVACSFDIDSKDNVYLNNKILCEKRVCVIQSLNSNEPVEFETMTISPEPLKGKIIENFFESSVIRIYYKDEKKEKIEFISVKNGDILTSMMFDDSLGMVQAVSSKKIGKEPFFTLLRNDSNKYYLYDYKRGE